MQDHPLSSPRDAQLLVRFLTHLGLSTESEPRRLLHDVATAFSRLPYENLTKILKESELGRAPSARRHPHEVITDHFARGTGGTCFSLTATLLHLLRSLGWHAEPILADRRYGSNTHCALVVSIDGQPHLLDPGYLIVDPIPLGPGGDTTVKTAFNRLVLEPTRGDLVQLHTLQQGHRAYRLTYKTTAVDPGEFLRAWDASFDWDMMHYPVLARVAGDKQLYLQDHRLQVRSHDETVRRELGGDDVVAEIVQRFGIDASVVTGALAVLKHRKGGGR